MDSHVLGKVNMDQVQAALKKRYPDLHPLLFERSLERAKSNGELFDFLEDATEAVLPIVWDSEERKWKHTDNLLQALIKKKPEE